MLDPTTLSPQNLGTHASQFGSGYDIHHSPSQRWAYIRHQMPDEAILLKCYDTDQGKGEERPRESVEVRLVAVWE
ncbi:hypothetical protein C369_07417 [Cryptococcus neoformans A5-35-17]|nr:hypothetical protein C369_07417 [Cryptococcus neoformans var. grubii A5-35-17]